MNYDHQSIVWESNGAGSGEISFHMYRRCSCVWDQFDSPRYRLCLPIAVHHAGSRWLSPHERTTPPVNGRKRRHPGGMPAMFRINRKNIRLVNEISEWAGTLSGCIGIGKLGPVVSLILRSTTGYRLGSLRLPKRVGRYHLLSIPLSFQFLGFDPDLRNSRSTAPSGTQPVLSRQRLCSQTFLPISTCAGGR